MALMSLSVQQPKRPLLPHQQRRLQAQRQVFVLNTSVKTAPVSRSMKCVTTLATVPNIATMKRNALVPQGRFSRPRRLLPLQHNHIAEWTNG
ncbi:hypothetical protein DPMN_060887 [Dreissena polymorpha]|uniref:Uncharacterized protein n=1 Tax=Dreissena polymorpha TaxID=45954 RepID=A0A9D4C613_DREPO|nr:hypothetical protein DPMN_060887 [Dreissena polymorpha]